MIYNKSLHKITNYSYDISSKINSNLNSITPSKELININICIFNITFDSTSHNILKPFLRYLLFKYPKSNNKFSDLLTFPFIPFKQSIHNSSSNIVKSANKLASKILNYNIKSIGYIISDNSIFLFYHHNFPEIASDNIILRNSQLWWSLIDEICNKKYVLTKEHINDYQNNTDLET